MDSELKKLQKRSELIEKEIFRLENMLSSYNSGLRIVQDAESREDIKLQIQNITNELSRLDQESLENETRILEQKSKIKDKKEKEEQDSKIIDLLLLLSGVGLPVKMLLKFVGINIAHPKQIALGCLVALGSILICIVTLFILVPSIESGTNTADNIKLVVEECTGENTGKCFECNSTSDAAGRNPNGDAMPECDINVF